jgi:hypothetical protein
MPKEGELTALGLMADFCLAGGVVWYARPLNCRTYACAMMGAGGGLFLEGVWMDRGCCWLDGEEEDASRGGIGHVPDSVNEMEAWLEWDLRWRYKQERGFL